MEQWEEEVLGEAVKALTRYRRRGMGSIQWCAKGVRQELGKMLWAAWCALLKEHARQLAHMYEEQSKLQVDGMLRAQPACLADGYWRIVKTYQDMGHPDG